MKKYLFALAVLGLSLAAAQAQPANDNFANRIALSGPMVSTTGSNVGAGTENNETIRNGTWINRVNWGTTVWWTWTAPVGGTVTIDTIGSSFDTVLAVYTGTALPGTQVAYSNDIGGGTNTSLVTFTAVAGTQYNIQVGGRNNATGSVALRVAMAFSVVITSPASGSLFAVGDNIPIAASATMPGTITQVAFYRNNTLIAADAVAPYSVILSNAPLGVSALQAVVADATGLSVTSAVVNVTVMNPGVVLTAPADGTTYSSPGALTLSASTVGITPTNVEFYAGQTKLGEDATSPYSITWNNQAGSFALTAVARTASGAAYVSTPVAIAVSAILVTSNSVWKYLDNGTDPGANWASAEFNDSTWASGPAPLGYGDSSGRLPQTTNSYGPSSTTKYPTTYYRQLIVVSNAASYTNLVLSIQRDDGAIVYLNGTDVGRFNMTADAVTYLSYAYGNAGDDGATTFTTNVAPALLREGTNVVAVEIHQDAADSSDIWFVMMLQGIPPIIRNQSPLVSWVNPTTSATLVAPATLTLEASASDPDGTVAGVEFFVDGLSLGVASNSPYRLVWNAPAVGFHSARAEVSDNLGAKTASTISFSVHDSAATPVVQVTSPTNGTVIAGLEVATNLPISAAAAGVGGVTNVVFFANGIAVGSDATSPFATTWMNAAFGTNSLVAVAYDAQGGVGTSAVATVVLVTPPTNTVAPAVATVTPARGATVTNLTSIQVVFTEKVTGVHASDLLVNGAAATAVSGSGSNYVFTVAQPAFGAVSITWAAGHGITDIGWPSSLAFDPLVTGNSWSYSLVDRTPPVIAAKTPAAGATLTSLTSVSVTFSKSVTGVDAADFLVNGVPALGVSGSGSSYTFAFAQPASGTVNLSWAAAHGITDLAATPNAFDASGTGATWTYMLDARTTLVSSNAMFTYLKGTSEASTPLDAWRAPAFNDTAWASGLAPFYYDVNVPPVYSGNTALTDMQNNYTCVFLRHRFVVNNVTAVTNILMRFRCDDGFIAWINGTEVARYGMVAGEPTYTTLASNATSVVMYTNTLPDPKTYLVEGTNVLAIQQFNTSSGSSDLLLHSEFYTYLANASVIPPRIQVVVPVAGDVYSLTNVLVKFTEPVGGVDAGDLLVNGVPAAAVAGGASNDTYTFSFSQPAFGPVAITWAPNHGIADFDQLAKAFDNTDAGATWQYSLVNSNAPTITVKVPAAGAVITNLTQIAVTFSEAVTGVDASDLLVNGLPAASVSGSGAAYTFSFAQPAYGTVAVTWTANHGIKDLDVPANDFSAASVGNTWTYSLRDLIPPAIASRTPAAGMQVTNLTQITVVFTEPVTGVDASDLLISGIPATNVVGSGAGPYTFSFTPPNDTDIKITWALAHGIRDLAASPNLFNAGAAEATWSYVMPDTVPPRMEVISPVAGATVPALTQVAVTFSETVSGVNASDLLVNGVPAAKVSGSLAGPYVFTFVQPAAGSVTLAWAANHGIHDLAQTQNTFAGGSWSYGLDLSGAQTNVLISELMYHPAPEMNEDSRQEWIELHNKGAVAVNLRGWQFSRGIKYTFGDAVLPADGYLVVAANVAEFQKRYPSVTNVVGGWEGTLSNNGDTLHLRNAQADLLVNLSYASAGDWAKHLRGLGERQLTLTRNGTTVTAYAFGHEYHTGDQIRVYGADQPEYNGTFTVTPTGPSTFTYTISGSPAAATGIIISRQITTCNGSYCYSGWSWSSLADGLGRSMELMNERLPFNQGQNWEASRVIYGTPGRANSVATNHIAPMILGLQHYPLVPRSTNAVTITARLVDENLAGVTAQLFYRSAGSSTLLNFTATPMWDDGLHGDGLAGDGVYGAQIAPQASLSITEFYVAATNSLGLGRTWPVAALDANDNLLQQANAHFQVDDSVYTGSQPIYRFVMTEPDRAELRAERDHDVNSENSLNAQMNMTFITIDSAESLCVYNCGTRNRGAGSRSSLPMNYRVSFPNDKRWKGVRGIHLNTQYTFSQLASSAVGMKAGIDVEAARVVQLLVNGSNLAYADNVAVTKGSYIQLENTDSDYAANHYPDDSGGNLYRGSKYPWDPNLSNYGTDPNAYYGARGKGYYKNSNVSENDWSDLITLSAVLNTNTPDDAVYAQAVRQVVNVEQWMRSIATYTLNGSGETGFQTGMGDDYAMYRGAKDPRFILLAHDLDSCFGQGGGVATNTHLFRMCPFLNNTGLLPRNDQNVTVLNRFMTNRFFAPIYYRQLSDLLNTAFEPGNAGRTIDQFLGDWASDVVPAMKTWATNRYYWVRAQIPLRLTITNSFTTNGGYAYSTSATISLSGRANAMDTWSVTVNGQAATWTAWQAVWSATGVSLNPGLNRLVVRAFNEAGAEIDRQLFDVWYSSTAETTVAGGSLSGNVVWTPGNPYHVTGSLTVPSGATLTIQPGVVVYFDSGVGLTVNGQLLAQGTAAAPIRFTRAPGSSSTWGSITISGANAPETRIAYAHLEYFGTPAIHASAGNLVLDHLTFGTTVNQYLALDSSSFIVQDCVFPTPTATGSSAFEPVHGTGGIKAGGRGIFLRNWFGVPNGYNDVIDFTGGNRDLGQPIVQFYDNVFTGASDDILDLDGTDAWIEGNIFMHAHRNGSPDSSSAISGGLTGSDRSEITIIGNLIYDCDMAANAKEGNFYTFLDNTIVRITKQGGTNESSAVALMSDVGTAEGAGMYFEGNLIYSAEALVAGRTNAVVTYTNNFIYDLQGAAWTGPGGGNLSVDPLFTHLPQLSETTNFATWAQAQVLWDWFKPQAGSPAEGKGPQGKVLGGVIPAGVFVSGEPNGVTTATAATLVVGINRTGSGISPTGFPNGSGYTHYKWRLDGGSWSAETPIGTPIALAGLGNGSHYVEVAGKNDAGLYQDDALLGTNHVATMSKVWIVETNAQALPAPVVRINEVLASNGRAVDVGGGSYPDLIELYNAGSVPADLAGMGITDNPDNPGKFTFAPGTILNPGQYLVVYADNNTTPAGIHLGFTLKQEGDDLYLFAASGQLMDSVAFGLQLTDFSIGRLSDGHWGLTQPTFGAVNVAAVIGNPTKLRINEWLARGLSTVPYDFVELFNGDSLPVELGGLVLTDNPIGAPQLSELAPLSFIAGGGYQVFYADGNPASGAEHLNFRLSPDRGIIALLNPQLVWIDSVLYGPQSTDVSQGRSPNGSVTLASFTVPTPGSPNRAAAVTPGTQLVINEVHVRNVAGANAITNLDGGTPAWVELYNPTASSITLADMSLSDSAAEPRRWVFPAGAILGAGGYLVVLCDPSQPASTNLAARMNTGYGLKSTGGEVYLFDKGVGGSQLDGLVYGLQAAEFSLGRVPSGSTNWSLNLPSPGGLNVAAALGDARQLKINEWMANPSSGSDWFELYNPNSQPVALGGLYLTDNLSTPASRQTFKIAPLSFLGTGFYGYARFWADSDLAAGADHCNFSLKASGESLGLTMEGDVRVDAIAFGLQTVGISEGRLPDGATNITQFPATASPGEANYLPLTNIVINEVLSAVPSNAPLEQAIELFNAGSTPVNVGGWYLSNMKHALKKYLIPGGTVLPAGGYLVVYQYQFNFDPRDAACFALDGLRGDNVYLSVADTNANLTGYRTVQDFGPAEPGVSFGRYTNSVGNVDFTAMSQRTFGANNPSSVAAFRLGTGTNNAYPLVGPVIVSEIMYRPADFPGAVDNVRDEYIELYNATSSAMSLYDPAHPTNTWRVRGGVDFDFPTNVALPAGGYLLVVSFDPVMDTNSLAGFRAAYPRLPSNVALYGPYAGKLANNGESVNLEKPGTPAAGYVPHILVEHVKYNQVIPWDALADGTGYALQRLSPTEYANDPVEWYAAGPSPGAEYAPSDDLDGDGIPDAWVQQYFGHASGLVDDQSRAGDDPDGDGLSNLQEYLAGTNPRDPASTLRLSLSASQPGVQVSLSLNLPADRSFSVLSAPSLTNAWTVYTNYPAVPTNRAFQLVIPTGNTNRFFRLSAP